MILNSYARAILKIFAEAYPFSAQLRGGRKLRKGNWHRVFPEMETDIAAKEDFLRTVEELGRTGVISVKWKRFREGDQAEALYLENPKLLFELTGGKDPKAVRETMLAITREWRPGTPLGKAVKEQLTTKLDYFHDIQISSEDDLKDILTIVDLTEEQVRGHTLRGLSVRLFRNSKRLEALLPMADKLSRSVEGRDISETLGLTRSFPEALFSFRGTISLDSSQGEKEWRTCFHPISFPERTVDRMTDVSVTEKRGRPRVLTVENKETYFIAVENLREQFDGFLYTGGYPNKAVTKLLERVTERGTALCHFGDLDPEGISIFLNLENTIKREIQPFLMNAEIYRKYAAYGYPLKKSALEKCKSITDPRFRDLTAEIEKYGRGVEQEVIDAGKEGGEDLPEEG